MSPGDSLGRLAFSTMNTYIIQQQIGSNFRWDESTRIMTYIRSRISNPNLDSLVGWMEEEFHHAVRQ